MHKIYNCPPGSWFVTMKNPDPKAEFNPFARAPSRRMFKAGLTEDLINDLHAGLILMLDELRVHCNPLTIAVEQIKVRESDGINSRISTTLPLPLTTYTQNEIFGQLLSKAQDIWPMGKSAMRAYYEREYLIDRIKDLEHIIDERLR